MIKKLLILLVTISINAMDTRAGFHKAIEGYFGKYEYVGSYGPSVNIVDILKAKYDIEFKNGRGASEDGQYLATVDENYYIIVYKKIKVLKRQDAFTEEKEEAKE